MYPSQKVGLISKSTSIHPAITALCTQESYRICRHFVVSKVIWSSP